MGSEVSVLKQSSEGNPREELFDILQPECLQNKTTHQEDFCSEASSIELLPIKSSSHISTVSNVENNLESREPLRFYRSSISFRNDKKLTMKQRVAEGEGWSAGLGGVKEALINERSVIKMCFRLIVSSRSFRSSSFLFLIARTPWFYMTTSHTYQYILMKWRPTQIKCIFPPGGG